MHNSGVLYSFKHHLQGILHKYKLHNLSLRVHAEELLRASFGPQNTYYWRWCMSEEASILSLENKAEMIGWVVRKVVLFVNSH